MKTIKQVHVEEDSDEDQLLPIQDDDYESDPDWHPPGAPEVRCLYRPQCLSPTLTLL